MEQEKRPEIPPGTLYMLVLKTLARLGPMHGYGIAQHVHRISDEVLQVEEGSLYPGSRSRPAPCTCWSSKRSPGWGRCMAMVSPSMSIGFPTRFCRSKKALFTPHCSGCSSKAG